MGDAELFDGFQGRVIDVIKLAAAVFGHGAIGLGASLVLPKWRTMSW